jgi:hypothetical protein
MKWISQQFEQCHNDYVSSVLNVQFVSQMRNRAEIHVEKCRLLGCDAVWLM